MCGVHSAFSLPNLRTSFFEFDVDPRCTVDSTLSVEGELVFAIAIEFFLVKLGASQEVNADSRCWRASE